MEKETNVNQFTIFLSLFLGIIFNTVALQLEDEVPDFPRGGGSSLNRQEQDEIRAEVDAEFKAGERELKKRKKKWMQKKSVVTEDDLGSLFGDGIFGKLPKCANMITTKVSR
ncbi:rRNA biogenesis protein RRP5-like [Pyrus x bretschneideri]|uniref:rRNA biogenesis protein RRP5-like n=1 Tax=Pyrus x bretschneideri TaxID=225117 RepID=UPI00202FEF89|nr:rRNA biogenesis protein RRP5-like [Pyrus x bretschneideri]